VPALSVASLLLPPAIRQKARLESSITKVKAVLRRRRTSVKQLFSLQAGRRCLHISVQELSQVLQQFGLDQAEAGRLALAAARLNSQATAEVMPVTLDNFLKLMATVPGSVVEDEVDVAEDALDAAPSPTAALQEMQINLEAGRFAIKVISHNRLVEVWTSRRIPGSEARPFSIWRPDLKTGAAAGGNSIQQGLRSLVGVGAGRLFMLGDVGKRGLDMPTTCLVAKLKPSKSLPKGAGLGLGLEAWMSRFLPRPVAYRLLWYDRRGAEPGPSSPGAGGLYVWRPVPPSDLYVALGAVCTTDSSEPRGVDVRCVPRAWLVRGDGLGSTLWSLGDRHEVKVQEQLGARLMCQEADAVMTLDLHVSGLSGCLCTVTAGYTWVVSDVKAAIEHATGISRWEQQLLAGTRELADMSPLSGEVLDLTLIRKQLEMKDWLSLIQEEPQILEHSAHWVKECRTIVLEAVKQDGQMLQHSKLCDDHEVALAAVSDCGLALAHVSASLRNDRQIVLAAVQEAGCALEFASGKLKNDAEVVLAAVRKDASALQHASRQLREDHRFLLAVIRRNSQAFSLLPIQWQSSREFALEAAEQNGDVLAHMPEAFQSDRDIASTAVRQNGLALRYTPSSLRDLKLVLEAVTENDAALQYAGEFQAQREVILSAIKPEGVALALQYASPALLHDESFLLDVVQKNPSALLHSSAESLHGCRRFILEAAHRNGSILSHASPDLQADRDVVLTAVKQHSASFMNAASGLRCDPCFALEAVAVNGLLLEYLSSDLCSDATIAKTAVQQNWKAIRFVPAALRSNRDLLMSAVQQNALALRYGTGDAVDVSVSLAAVSSDWRALQFVPLHLKCNLQIVNAAVKQDPRALQYVPRDVQMRVLLPTYE
ncbi:unnamed protein product, partial [Effrenium voratum]